MVVAISISRARLGGAMIDEYLFGLYGGFMF